MQQKQKATLALIPVFGCILYVILYLVAASLYPGGSNFDKASKGYHWNLNYWCELLAATAKNGEPNTGRPFAFAAMFIMAISIGIIWYLLPIIFQHKHRMLTIRYCGLIAMLVSLLLPFAHHDTVINISAFFTVIALLSTFVGLYTSSFYRLLLLGLLCFALATANKLVYEIAPQNRLLPVIQEINFSCSLLWFSLVSWRIRRHWQIPQSESATPILNDFV